MIQEKLINFTPEGKKERLSQAQIVALYPYAPECLYRSYFKPGHITGSGVLVSADGQRVLLNHHKFLDKWLYFGGHADGDSDILNVARREVEEESGLNDFDLAYNDILSLDVHTIPENAAKGEPGHKHFDVLYLFQMRKGSNETPALSDESVTLKWAAWNTLEQFSLDPHVLFALHKALRLLSS